MPPSPTVRTAKPVVARPMEPLTLPPPTLALTMWTTERTLEDTEPLAGTLTTPSCSDQEDTNVIINNSTDVIITKDTPTDGDRNKTKTSSDAK